MTPMDNHCVRTSTTGLVFPANYNMHEINASSGFHSVVDSSASVAGVKPEAALVMDWSVEEQYVLENGLAKLKNEPRISKYAKVAATLPDKTVRDVALRCRWMSRKRRKRQNNNAAKNISNMKVVDTSPEMNMLSNVPQQNALYAMNNMCHNTRMYFEGLVIFSSSTELSGLEKNENQYGQLGTFVDLFFSGVGDTVMDLLQQNAQAFSQISCNLSACNLQDNISLFYQARNNISAILTDMKEMPGIMSRMPALPVSVNNDLASYLLSSTSQPISYTIPPSIYLKQEPRS